MPEETNSITPDFWIKCERLLRLFPNHPEKFSGDAEVAQVTRQLRTLVSEAASQLVPSEYWKGDASVGKGNWTNIPWIAIFDERESTSAQKGVYPVIHFRCDENPGLRLGLGVAATEFKSNPEAKATEVRDELSLSDLEAVTEAGFTDVTRTWGLPGKSSVCIHGKQALQVQW